MTNSKTTKRALFSSTVALLLCFTMLLGTTFAWFTDSAASGSNVITAGNLDIIAQYTLDGENWKELDGATDLFQKGLWEPGHTEVVAIRLKNNGTLALKYAANMNIVSETIGKNADNGDITLSEILTVSTLVQQANQIGDITLALAFNGENSVAYENTATFKAGNVLRSDVELHPGDTHYMIVKVDMAETVGNEANHNGTNIPKINFGINVLATQFTYENDSFGNQYDKDAEYPEAEADTWDGTADISWYNDTDAEFTLSTAEQLAGLADLVDAGNTFEGKVFTLTSDVDLYAEDENGEPISFEPIGYGYDVVFKGTFDGQGHTIKNLYQNGWALGYDYSTEGGGLFASVVDSTIKNINIDSAEIVMECIDMGIVVGYSYGNCTYENISITNSSISNYNRYTGGVVGEVNGVQTFKNVDIDASTKVSTLWGSFDTAVGGIIGGKYGEATLIFEDCDVACQIDAYNDITATPARQWHAYRRAGMLIGNSEESKTVDGRTEATASYLTATNCTVTYGDWANYTYCEFNNMSTNWPHCRVQAGSASAYTNARYGVANDLNGNKVIDDNHVHAENEDHNMLIAFDQLFGGDVGVYGGNTHEGVTITR